MSTIEHKTRIEIIRNDVIVKTITLDTKSEPDDYIISSNSSMSSFPTLSIISSNPEINIPFIDFARNDIIKLSISKLPNKEFITFFVGEFSNQSTKFESNHEKLELEIGAIHSFFKLSLVELTSPKEFIDLNFGEIITDLANIAGIHSKITIDENLSSKKIMGFSKNTNALRFFKEICFIANASVTFNIDNSVDIDCREKKLAEFKSRTVHKISRENIISMKSENSI